MSRISFEPQDVRKQINLKIPKDLANQLDEFMDRYPYSKFSGIIIAALRTYLTIELSSPKLKIGIIDKKNQEAK